MDRSYYRYNQLKTVFKIIKKLPVKSILDLGCGEGYLEEAFPDKKIVAVDLDEESLKKAKEKAPWAKYIKTDIKNLLLTEKFDLVTLIAVLGGINEEELFFKKLNQFLKPNGFLVIFVTQNIFPYCFFSPIRLKRKKWRFFKSKDIITKLEKYGFSLYDINYFGGPLTLLFNLIYLFLNKVLKIFKIRFSYKFFSWLESIEFLQSRPSWLSNFICLIFQKKYE
jgi:predicted TPR repeat methyltransferase